ncbi:MAG: excinuclease ABC subunit UvrA [Hyphomicrobiales bacterium]
MKNKQSEQNIDYIEIRGAKVNNLKNIYTKMPRKKIIVITGLSGSGKSSLAFDTLYAEGQRRYVESLSSYARQFLGRMSKPEVESIKGISPAIAIEQKVNTRNPHSTVGTSTEIYEYLKLLFARIGKTYSPISGDLVKRHTIKDVSEFILGLNNGVKLYVLAPFILNSDRTINEQLEILLKQGFARIIINKKDIIRIDELLKDEKYAAIDNENLSILIDRLKVKHDDSFQSRLSDSLQTAFYEGHGKCIIGQINDNTQDIIYHHFSNKFELDGMTFEEPSLNMFTFNNPVGACKKCEGFGSIIGIDEDLVIPNKNLSIYDGAIACWKGEKMGEWKNQLVNNAYKFDFPIHKPFYELDNKLKKLIWKGNEYFRGLDEFFDMLEENTYKIQYRVMLSRYRGKTLCPECNGTRLRKDASYVKITGHSIKDLLVMPVDELLGFFSNIKLNEHDFQVSKRLLIEIKNRLQFLNDVGLGYLNLNRLSSSLSGGESQRINLATSLGSSLVGSMYILDEPSIGLHPRDTHLLIKVLKQLRDIGNTVIIVEHEEEIIKAADYIIDIGPKAGAHGGEVVFQGEFKDLLSSDKSLTAAFFLDKLNIPIPEKRRKWNDFIEIKGARENNLKNINVRFPLRTLNVITGVSGSGKSSLVKNVLYPAIKKIHGGSKERSGKLDLIQGSINSIQAVEYINQNPIGRSSRSNPATYVKAWDDIRTIYAGQALSKKRAYKTGFFSFNIPGGRCEACEGEGTVKIEMLFMADIELKCEECNGKRFKDEVLDIKYKDKTITDILDMTINQAIAFFSDPNDRNEKKVIAKLKPLQDVGLGYLKLGQASSTLSGGEAQRIKLAYFLGKGDKEAPTLFIFDEPTTGLHFYDINQLLVAFNALIDKGHSLIVIEHNIEVIKSADWIIDLGPEGGNNGGYVIFEGTPENLINVEQSYTAKYLKSKFE